MEDIPEELVEDILSRLPVESLVRLKTVSKYWYSLLSQDYNFAKFHLKKSESENRLFFQNPIGETTFQSSNIDDTNSSRKFYFPVGILGTKCNLIGSANGLICVTPINKGVCFIWNPCTREYKKISTQYMIRGGYRLFGFGYDSCSDDYKIVGNWGNNFRVFSLKTNSWKDKILDYSFLTIEIVNAVHLNGVLHWCTLGRTIAVFDLATEKFFHMEMPEEVELKRIIYGCVPLFVYQGSLCASGGKSIWVMKEYGDSKCWAKLTTFVAKLEYSIPVGISRLGEVVFHTYDRFEAGLVKSDIQGRISDNELPFIYNYAHAFVYKESLISPKCFESKKVKKRPRKQRKLN